MRPADLNRHKRNGRSISILTAWDSLSAALVEAAGADAVLVGDSLAMVALGHATTLPVTLDEMRHHTLAVSRGFQAPLAQQPLLICDLPFLSYRVALKKPSTAGLLKTRCRVKLEGAEPEVIEVIDRVVRMGIPVMGHLGLTSQAVHRLVIDARRRTGSARSAAGTGRGPGSVGCSLLRWSTCPPLWPVR